MIKIELLNNNTLIKHYSDKKVMLLQQETGIKYADPVDIYPCPYTYVETDEPTYPEEEGGNPDGFSDAEFRTMVEGAL